MRGVLLFAVCLASSGCPRSVAPCEPWIRWELSDMADAPGQRIEQCDATHLRFRVIPGGTRAAFLKQLGSRPYAGWRTWKETVLVRSGEPAVVLEVREDGADLVVELRPEPGIDVNRALRELDGP
ncbi:MAG: hypothetical protein AB1938_18485 [Myxococcota bacterium]